MMAVPDVSGKSIAELISLQGRTAVVTGGARGIGLAICQRLAEAGANIVIGDVREEAGREAAENLGRQWGLKALFSRTDVTDSASVAQLADTAVRALGGIDIWVNNAGIYPSNQVTETSDEQWDLVVSVNLRGTFLGSREAAKRMVAAQRGGVIINLASTAAFQGESGKGHYAAAKHGVLGLTRSLAIELGPHSIRVLAVAPTATMTPGVAETGLDPKRLEPPILGRVGLPDDMARVVLFCASDLAVMMTGSTVAVDGGHLAG
jgi:NAD(P)-dependent dehydrogenase (short-subunit alcohol dehydrogenase family)